MASGSNIPDLGTTVIPARTQEGLNTSIRWKNAKVAMPMLSTHEIARNKTSLEYFEDGGQIGCRNEHKVIAKFIQAAGVYFQKIYGPRSVAGKQDGKQAEKQEGTQGGDPPEGFARR